SGLVYGSSYPENIRFASPGRTIVSLSGGLGFRPDSVVDRVEDLNAAAKMGKHSDKRPTFTPLEFHFPAIETAKTELTREERIYGLLKAWYVICHCYPNLEYAAPDWKSTVANFIPRVEQAADFLQYYRTLREWTASLHDSHVSLAGGPPRKTNGFVPAQ